MNLGYQLRNAVNTLSTLWFTLYLVITITVEAGAATIWSEDLDGEITFGSYRNIYVEGDISEGDLNRIVELADGNFVMNVYLWSRGGSVIEAMRISEYLNKNLIRAIAPSGISKKCSGEYAPIEDSNCTCASACALIWATAPLRRGKVVGLHRPYFNPDDYRDMSAEEAQKSFEAMTAAVSDFLESNSVPVSLIEKMNRTSSDKIHFLTADELKLLGTVKPFLSELVAARCSQYSEDKASLDVALAKRKDAITKTKEIAADVATQYKSKKASKAQLLKAREEHETAVKDYNDFLADAKKYDPYLSCPSKEARAMAEEAQGYSAPEIDIKIKNALEVPNEQSELQTTLDRLYNSSHQPEFGEIKKIVKKYSGHNASFWGCSLANADMPEQIRSTQKTDKREILRCSHYQHTYYVAYDPKTSRLAQFKNSQDGTRVRFSGTIQLLEEPLMSPFIEGEIPIFVDAK